MDYFETLEYLFTQLPIYQRQGAAAYKADLANTEAIMSMLDHPEQSIKCIHIAGTNGKGSVAHLIASALQEQGYKTGLYTSPHLKDFRERIRVNGVMIDQDEVTAFVSEYREQWEPIKPSFFEITVGMAFWYFRKSGTDINVIETGMGGRLDSTNVISPEVAVITNIGMDHTQFLGDTIEKIAQEKGGIIKKGVPTVLGVMEKAAEDVLTAIANERGSGVFRAADLDDNLPATDLIGSFQIENRKAALVALKTLRSIGWELSFESIVKGFAKVSDNTGIQGRWHELGQNPLIIADAAHNAEGLTKVMDDLGRKRRGELHIVLGVVVDKDLDNILPLFPTNANYYFCKADIPRAMAADTLRQKAFAFGLKGEDYSSVEKALSAARLYSTKEDTIFVGGSFFTVAEVL